MMSLSVVNTSSTRKMAEFDYFASFCTLQNLYSDCAYLAVHLHSQVGGEIPMTIEGYQETHGAYPCRNPGGNPGMPGNELQGR